MNKPVTAKEIIYSLKERFMPDKAEPGYETTFHINLSGDGGGDFTVEIIDGEINVSDGLQGDAKCTVTAKASIYEEVEWGKTNPQMAFLTGKVKVSDIGEMLDFAGLFHRCEDFYK